MFQFGKYYLEDFTSWILFHLREPQTYRYYRGQDYVLIFIDADIVFLLSWTVIISYCHS